MKILLYLGITVGILLAALYIGKTTITNGSISIERPVTAVLFILTMLAAILNK
jgi:hypothetical protein